MWNLKVACTNQSTIDIQSVKYAYSVNGADIRFTETLSFEPALQAYGRWTTEERLEMVEDGSLNVIKYQMNFPAPGDPYHIAACTRRDAYYNATVLGVPALIYNAESNMMDWQISSNEEFNLPAQGVYAVRNRSYTIKVLNM